jgi:hypothetical protein
LRWIRPRFCSSAKLGMPRASLMITSPSITNCSYGNAATYSATSGNVWVKSWPARE